MIEPIQPTHRNKFSNEKAPVEVYTTPDRELFLKIDHQTFQVYCPTGADESDYKYEEWLASQICIAINRLMKRCCGEFYDATPLTFKLASKRGHPRQGGRVMAIGKVIKDNGRWFTWCERNQCPKNPFTDEGCKILDIMFPDLNEDQTNDK